MTVEGELREALVSLSLATHTGLEFWLDQDLEDLFLWIDAVQKVLQNQAKTMRRHG